MKADRHANGVSIRPPGRSPSESRSALSVIIPSYNRQDILCQTINSVLEQRFPALEIIVVDQTPGTPIVPLQQLVERHRRIIRYIRQTPANLPKARNTGIEAASSEYLLFIDDDVILPSGFIESHMLRLESDPAIGAVTGPIIDQLADPQSVSLSPFQRTFDLSLHSPEQEFAYASWFAGGNFSAKRSVLNRVGPFDESFTGSAYCEDVDMGVRVRKSGFKIAFDRHAWLVHLAMRSGGCETRNESIAEEKARERFQHLIYCRLKHVGMQGPELTARLLYRAFRSYVLNRPTLSRGSIYTLKRILAAVSELIKAGRRLLRYESFGAPYPRPQL